MNSDIFENYSPKDKSSLIPLLQDVQNKFGYLPEKELQEVADFVGIPLSRVYGVATFYNQFRLVQQGENIIRVCRGTACHVKSSANILFAIETALKIKAGETTRDKKFSIELVNCIGACSIAPVITVNEDYYGRLTVKEIPAILKKYSAPKSKTAGAEKETSVA